MNRSDEPLFDARIADWLEEDPHAAPDPALVVVLAAFPSIKQRRAWRVPWRFPEMPTLSKLVAALATVIIVAVGGVYLLAPRFDSSAGGPPPSPSSNVSPSPSQAAMPSPTPGPIDTSTWVDYTSDRYGFSAAYPETFGSSRARKFWVVPESNATTSAEWDLFYGGPGNNAWNASSILLPTGMTEEAWIDDYRRVQMGLDPTLAATCFPPPEEWAPVTIDGRTAALRVGCGSMEALVFTDGRAYSFGGWTTMTSTTTPGVPDSILSLFEAWLTTIRLDPASALEPPAGSAPPS